MFHKGLIVPLSQLITQNVTFLFAISKSNKVSQENIRWHSNSENDFPTTCFRLRYNSITTCGFELRKQFANTIIVLHSPFATVSQVQFVLIKLLNHMYNIT